MISNGWCATCKNSGLDDRHITMQKLSSMQKRLCMHEKGNVSIDILIRVILILFALTSYLAYIYIYIQAVGRMPAGYILSAFLGVSLESRALRLKGRVHPKEPRG